MPSWTSQRHSMLGLVRSPFMGFGLILHVPPRSAQCPLQTFKGSKTSGSISDARLSIVVPEALCSWVIKEIMSWRVFGRKKGGKMKVRRRTKLEAKVTSFVLKVSWRMKWLELMLFLSSMSLNSRTSQWLRIPSLVHSSLKVLIMMIQYQIWTCNYFNCLMCSVACNHSEQTHKK